MLLTATQLFDLAFDLIKAKRSGEPAVSGYRNPLKSQIKVDDPYDVPDHVDHHMRSVLGDEWKDHLRKYTSEVNSGRKPPDSSVASATKTWLSGGHHSFSHARGAGQAVLTHDKQAMEHLREIRNPGQQIDHRAGVTAAVLSRLPLNKEIVQKHSGSKEPVTHLHRSSGQSMKHVKVGDHIHLAAPTSFSSRSDVFDSPGTTQMKMKLPSRGFSPGRHFDNGQNEVIVSGHYRVTHVHHGPEGSKIHVEEHPDNVIHKSFCSDLDLIKAKKQPTQTGPRGGRFYLTQSGERVYGEGKVEAPNTLAHVVSAPHQSASHEDVEVQIIPGRKEPASMRQKMMIKPPKSMADKQSRRAYIQEYSRGNWPAYFCRNCKAAIIPNHDHPVTENREVEDLRTGEKTNIPETVGHTTLVTQMHTVGDKSGQKEQIDPPDPAAVAQRLCPTCFGQHEILSREVSGRFKKEKPTKESKAKSRELKAMARQLKVALKKPDRERFPGEQSMVREHEAIQRVRERAEADRIKAEGPSVTERREKEAARFEKEEADAVTKLREQFKDHLVRQGMDENEAESASHSLTDKDIHEYRQERSRVASIRREETSKRLSQELSGKKIARVIGMGDLMDLLARRAEGGSAHEHAATVEGLHPSLARAEEEVRTRRLRERKEEMERAKPKKVKKSLELWVSL